MKQIRVSVAEAKKRLSELIHAAENGESVTVCRRGVPVAELVPTRKSAGKRPKFGTLRGKIVVNDPDWWKPLTERETDGFLEGS
jgi:prevent-host-death family protein